MMNENQIPYEYAVDKINSWKQLSYNNLKEGDLVRLLDQADGLTDYQTGELKAMLSAARYERKEEWDGRIDAWLTEALEQAPESEYTANAIMHLASRTMDEPWIEDTLPKIRETDHSQGKKKKIDELIRMIKQAQAWFFEIQGRKELISHALKNADRNSVKEQVTSLLQLAEEIGPKLESVAGHADDFKSSISGIYSSKEKKTSLDDALTELTDLLAQWDEAREYVQTENKTALSDLNRMVGINEVKQQVETYYYYLDYQRERQREGYHFENERSLNMILTGNPGTGKTAIARLLAKIYHQLGVLPRETVVEADRSRLVGAYVGQTEEKTMDLIKEAVGGVLFIDEAYSLKREGASGTDYGQTVIDTLVSAMTSGDYAGRFAVILAGYPEEMRNFIRSNPGLRSRFPESNHIHLPDFSMDELVEIAEHVALDNDFSLTDDALKQLRKRLEKEKVDETFGNARTAKNIVMDAIFKKGADVAKDNNYSKETFTVLDESAFKANDSAQSSHRPAEDKLNELIGLENVKEEVKKLSSFVKIQKERERKDMPAVPVQLHAVFTGPPGTGKTTVAHIFSEILYELDLLKRGHVVIAGRSDLVAGYVGQTARKTKKKIREALGGVLFIDEAYSLLSSSGQDFGQEAVNTLVEEMTKHEDNLVVILAGYSDNMHRLIQSNPGLESRFKKFIRFPSYSADDLFKILNYYVNYYGYGLTRQAKDALKVKLADEHPAGNARAMKDLVEDAVQRQAYRLIYNDNETADLSTLEEADFWILSEEEQMNAD